MEEFIKICLEISNFIEELTEVENKKFQAALQNNIYIVNECMKKEQAFLMKLKGIDKKREALQKKLGYEDLSFAEIIEKAPSNEKDKLKEVFNKVQNNYKVYKEIFSNAQNALEVNLYKINKKLEELNAVDKLNKTYKEDGEVIMSKESFTSRKV